MRTEEPNPASAKDPIEGSRDEVNPNCPPPEKCGTDDFKSKVDLPGKTDSGPEPDVFGKEIPPQ
jgi:hypothetical protein